jgi:hypothetical protein
MKGHAPKRWNRINVVIKKFSLWFIYINMLLNLIGEGLLIYIYIYIYISNFAWTNSHIAYLGVRCQPYQGSHRLDFYNIKCPNPNKYLRKQLYLSPLINGTIQRFIYLKGTCTDLPNVLSAISKTIYLHVSKYTLWNICLIKAWELMLI